MSPNLRKVFIGFYINFSIFRILHQLSLQPQQQLQQLQCPHQLSLQPQQQLQQQQDQLQQPQLQQQDQQPQ